MLNFVNAPQHRAADWRAALARLGLHAVVEFDTVAPALDGERQLYARLAVLLDRHAAALTRRPTRSCGSARSAAPPPSSCWPTC